MTRDEILNFYPKLRALVDDPVTYNHELYNLYTLELSLTVKHRYAKSFLDPLNPYTPAHRILNQDYYKKQCYCNSYRDRKSIFDAIYNFFSTFTDDEVLAYINLFLECIPHHEHETGIFELPMQHTYALEDYLPGHHQVLVPYAQAHGPALKKIVKRHPQVQFALAYKRPCCNLPPPLQHRPGELLGYAYYSCKNIRPIVYDMDTPHSISGRFDLIFACPRLDQNLTPGQQDSAQLSDILAMQKLLPLLKSDGVLAITLPAERAVSTCEQHPVREMLGQRFFIKEISLLPYHVLCGRQIKPAWFVFSAGRPAHFMLTHTLPVAQQSIKGKIIPPGKKLERVMPYDAFQQLSSWEREIICAGNNAIFRKFEEAQVTGKPLAKYAKIFAGIKLRTSPSHAEQGVMSEYCLITAEQINTAGIQYQALQRCNIAREQAAKYVLEEGDVLVCPGIITQVNIFERQILECIAAEGVLVIRPKTGLNSLYLKLLLESPAGELMLNSLRRDPTCNFSFTDRELKTIEFPLPRLEHQECLAREYLSRKQAYEQALALENQKIKDAHASICRQQQDWQDFETTIRAKLF